MPVLRRRSAAAAQPGRRTGKGSATLLTDTSPYGSRRVVVETDGITTAAYLKDGRDQVIGASWITNHRPATAALDLARLNAGLVPVMPAPLVKEPGGSPALDPRTLEAVWFEEGDGVAIVAAGEPLCVIPGWSDMSRGIPGYSSAATARSPFAFPLDEDLAEFAPRIERSRAFWQWQAAPSSWEGYQSSVLGHLLTKLGPGGHYWHDVGGQFQTTEPADATGTGAVTPSPGAPVVGVSERPARDGRDFGVLASVGMSCQRMPTVELYEDDVSAYARIELAVATTLPAPRAGSIFPWLAQYPWRSVTWFAPGDVVKWYHRPETFPLGPQWEGVLLLDDPSRLAGPAAPDMSGFSFGGDPVRWLWLVPITDEERRFAKAEGSNALIRRLAAEGRSWVVS